MKRAIALMAASLLASAAAISSPVFADNGGGGHGKGGEHGASDNGRGEGKGSEARANAPGQMKGDGESAKRYAPGQQMADDDDQIDDDDDQIAEDEDDVDETETASIRNPNFGALISAIRSGNVDLSGVESSTDVNVVEIDDLLKGNNRSALDNALADNEEQISQLRTDLGELDVEGLSDDQINGAVAARTEADGSLTVYVE